MKILFLVPYPLQESPSQRFRFEQYFQLLENQHHQIKVQSFFNQQEWQLFYRPGHLAKKIFALLKGFLKRIQALFLSTAYDFVFVHRELTPVGPPVFEWFIARVLRKKIIYDFDDAIWLTDRNEESILLKAMKWRSKTASICRWSYKVSGGNQYLTHFALKFNPNAFVNPTTIDTENYHNRKLFLNENKSKNTVIIGWTGSHSTLKYLKILEPVLQKLEEKYSQLSFVVIADQSPQLDLKRVNFIRWNPATEIKDLLGIDIGIMPLPDDAWAQGKCGFKALQYMALEIPAVVSPVGVNTDIITKGIDGYLCQSEQEWFAALEELILNPELRNTLGINGRDKVVKNYSVISNSSNFLSLFE